MSVCYKETRAAISLLFWSTGKKQMFPLRIRVSNIKTHRSPTNRLQDTTNTPTYWKPVTEILVCKPPELSSLSQLAPCVGFMEWSVTRSRSYFGCHVLWLSNL